MNRILTEPIIAYRAWTRKNGDSLHSMSMNAIWTPRKRATAQCDKHARGPGVDCECGIWAFKSVEQLVRSYGSNAVVGDAVIGRIALWGVVQVHRSGYRAQYAYPQLFFNIPEVASHTKLAEAWGIETAPLPGDQQAAIEPYVETIRLRKLHASWDYAFATMVDKSIPILDVAKIREREDLRRQHEAQMSSYAGMYYSHGSPTLL